MNTFEFAKEQRGKESSDELFSRAVKAGRRTYFFDVKATRNNDYYIVITESRKKQGEGDTCTYDKQKLYLYKEDFTKFINGLRESVDYIVANHPELFNEEGEALTPEPVPVLSIDEEFERL